MTEPHVLLQSSGWLRDGDLTRYHRYTFAVPSVEITALEVQLTYTCPNGDGRIYPVVIGPNGFRGFSMARDGREQRQLRLWFGETGASPGSMPGAIETGSWQLILDPLGLSGASQFTFVVIAHRALPHPPSNWAKGFPEGHVARDQADWYAGELHAHTHHSDGVDSTDELVAAAAHVGLDFLALTDHFTTSGFGELGAAQRKFPQIALLRGLELTSHRGHGNIHGVRQWLDPLIDCPERAINDLIDDIHRHGGLFCVNHPYSNRLGWQRHDLDWSKVDLLEVYHHLEHQHNTWQLALWDQLLMRGHRIVGVAGTDTHEAWKGRHRLGQCVTVVYADNLSEGKIIAGLKRGQAYVTLGPRLSVHAECAGERFEMFEQAPLAPLRLVVHTQALDRPAVLFALKNGLYLNHYRLSSGESAVTIEDHPQAPCYYRFEWHAEPIYQGHSGTYRSYETFMAASNPIFAG